jgi:glycosyltransferase involved in cell wall biosynthesis
VQVRGELGIDDDVVLAGYLGSYAFYHDATCLVRAAALIDEQRSDRRVKVLMVGAGKEYPESRALAEELGVLDETLLMLPGVPKDRVPGILSAIDIAVLPGSTDIICPIKVQEYMASLLPTVAPDYVCNREVLHDGVTGELFAPKDAEALASKILRLANDEAQRLRMGQQARVDAAKCFSWQATWGAVLDRILIETVS